MLTKAGKNKVERKISFYSGLSKFLFGKKFIPNYSAPKIGCVYAFEMSDDTVKIGVTTNLENRKKAVKGAVYLDVLRVHHTDFAPLTFMYTIERRCHNVFNSFRVRGEYFAITFEEACTELDRHADEIAAALKTADENFIDELKYYEELKEQFFATPLVADPAPAAKPAAKEPDLARVYLLQLSDNSVTIGHSKNIRARGTKIKRETGLNIINLYFTPEMPREDACLVELASQTKLSSRRVKGEFFSVDFDEARNVVDYFVEITLAALPNQSANLIADK